MPEQAVTITADDQISLEGGFSPLERGRGGALILHPHPRYGGSMANNVVEALRRGASQAGWGTLRFNFRGVGRSGGRQGDDRAAVADTLAAARWLAQRQPGPLALLGYSFGCLVGSLAAEKIAGLERGLWVAPPLALGDLAPWPPGAGPLLIMAGAADEFTSVPRLEAYVRQTGARARLQTIPGLDHFWWGQESALTAATTAFMGGAVGLPAE